MCEYLNLATGAEDQFGALVFLFQTSTSEQKVYGGDGLGSGLHVKENESGGVKDEYTTKLTFTHPPRNNKPSLSDGAIDEVAFVKQNMKDKLKEKVRRNNNLAVEIQGSIIVTSK